MFNLTIVALVLVTFITFSLFCPFFVVVSPQQKDKSLHSSVFTTIQRSSLLNKEYWTGVGADGLREDQGVCGASRSIAD